MTQRVKITREKELETEIVSQLLASSDQSTESLRFVRKEWSRKLALAPGHMVLNLARRLVARRESAFRFLALELIYFHPSALEKVGVTELKHMGRGMTSWGDVDMFAYYLSGPAWRAGQISDSVVDEWARSKDKWWRRAALVSTVPLNSRARGGTGDTRRTLRICELLVGDREETVVKALSWSLRELAKRDDAAVRKFLLQHEARIAARVKREVNNKLSTGLKNPRPK